MTQLNFTGTGITESSAADALPPAWYPVIVSAEECKPTRKNLDRVPGSEGDQYLQLELTVLSGQFEGRKTWWRFNLWNQNPTAVKIATEEFDAMIGSAGMRGIGDSSELINQRFEVKLAIEGNNNNVKAVRPLQSGLPPAPGAQAPLPGTAAQAPAQAAPGAVAPPVAPAAAQPATFTPAQATAPWAK